MAVSEKCCDIVYLKWREKEWERERERESLDRKKERKTDERERERGFREKERKTDERGRQKERERKEHSQFFVCFPSGEFFSIFFFSKKILIFIPSLFSNLCDSGFFLLLKTWVCRLKELYLLKSIYNHD